MVGGGIADLITARASSRAIPGFVAYNLETVQGIVRAAETTHSPVLLLAGSNPFSHAGLEALAGIALAEARRSEVEIGVHLDHSRKLEEIAACLELGYTSVMFDGSRLPFAENVAATREVVTLARRHGAWVEAELCGIPGDEDVSSDATATALTDPVAAAEFAATTGVDALAVAVGNVHGLSVVEPVIDLDRLERIGNATALPLVLHGASGLSPEVLLACLDRGVAKVNVNAELRRAFLEAFEAALPEALRRNDLATPLADGRDAVTARATEIIRLLAREPAVVGAMVT